MKNRWILIGLLLLSQAFLQAYEEHSPKVFIAQMQGIEYIPEKNWTDWVVKIGHLHHIFVHFPIALLTMAVFAEILFAWYRTSFFENAAVFMIISTAVLMPITALLGFALSLGQFYPATLNDVFVWHRYFGVVTVILALWTCHLRNQYGRDSSKGLCSYYICLFFSFLVVNLTGLLGNTLTLGWNL
ncbi:DUF2231 domain-containing protein [Candidatus Protochlamydia amoebophila]|uniref:DUF2231 domain-containing protein n=1 Tax=Candidatus Protochlamydia amoebophila TaxID=362787 RepID=UPI001BC9431C|nr:DUF2231 domain-containing protein [Candidatus Protochlamydia amoebophila]